jgi:antitoxin VapB
MQTAKIFKNGLSQAVRLPKEFRLPGNMASVTRMGRAVVLQPLPRTWSKIFQEMRAIDSDDMLVNREDMPPQERESL